MPSSVRVQPTFNKFRWGYRLGVCSIPPIPWYRLFMVETKYKYIIPGVAALVTTGRVVVFDDLGAKVDRQNPTPG